jgi:hypothetical protein
MKYPLRAAECHIGSIHFLGAMSADNQMVFQMQHINEDSVKMCREIVAWLNEKQVLAAGQRPA